MKFTKMHGLGNDYVYINCFHEKVEHPETLAVKVSDRHTGIGSDGLILIQPSHRADFFMSMYNADGSRAEMCGNGIRCVAKYVYDYGMTDKTKLTIDTLAGIKELDLTVEDGKVSRVKVNMGVPVLEPKQIPVDSDLPRFVSQPVEVLGKTYFLTAVSMGNPHGVLFVDDVSSCPLETLGPALETHPLFPKKANIEFVQVDNRYEIRMRVWERGSGETMACGTGACASAVASVLNGKTDDAVLVHLAGGDLEIQWDQEKDTVYMTGSATVVFDGEIQ